MKKIVKNIILLLIPAFLISIGFIWHCKPILITGFFQNQEYSRNLYKQAMEFQKNEDFKNAYYTYGMISKKYKAYDIVLYQQAKSAASIEDEKTAIEKYNKILKSYPDSPIAPLASYNLGQAYIRYGKTAEAEQQFLHTSRAFAGTDYALGSFYYLGELNKEKDKETAIDYWNKYIAIAPAGKFAIHSYEGLKSLNYQFTQKDKKLVGIALFMQQKHKDALKYLDQLPQEETWYYRGFCHKYLGHRYNAALIFYEGLKNHLDESIDRSKLEKAMLAYIQTSRNNKSKSWSNISHWTDRAKDFVLYQKAQRTSLKRARKYYEEIYEDYAYGNFASDALWNLFWYQYDKGDYDKALELGENHLSSYKNTKDSPAIHFWMGKIYEKKGNKSQAEKFYKITLAKFPDSYYAFRANGRIAALKGKKDTGWKINIKNKLPNEPFETKTPYSYNEIIEKHGIQAAELILMEDYDTALLFTSEDHFLESWVKLQKEIVTSSIVSARKGMSHLINKPNAKDAKWKLIYPVYFAEEINQNAASNHLDPVIVISLLKEESHFNPFAVSYSDARGLMQVLPVTARDIARWKKLGKYSSRQLFNPEINVKIGTSYLGFTKDVFDGNMLFAVASYNAGPTAVKTWTKRLSTSDLDRFIENIPYNQTRNYVKKVFGSYWNYKRIYDFE